jgi:hypothetical protein
VGDEGEFDVVEHVAPVSEIALDADEVDDDTEGKSADDTGENPENESPGSPVSRVRVFVWGISPAASCQAGTKADQLTLRRTTWRAASAMPMAAPPAASGIQRSPPVLGSVVPPIRVVVVAAVVVVVTIGTVVEQPGLLGPLGQEGPDGPEGFD